MHLSTLPALQKTAESNSKKDLLQLFFFSVLFYRIKKRLSQVFFNYFFDT